MIVPLLLVALGQATPPPPVAPVVPHTCAEIDARIAKRRHFLSVRRQEQRVGGPYVRSRYCLSNPTDEDCQLPPPDQDQRDISRDVSEYVQQPDAGPPDTDPFIVPLLRKRLELHCPGKPPPPPPGEE